MSDVNIAKMTGKQLQDQRLADMRDIMATEQGRRVVWELMDKCGLMSRNPALDPALMNRNEGKRDLGVDLHEWVMEAAPGSFLTMLQTRAQEMEK
tara:strand:- start:12133 stop:12417 length:285 start_codon:yes stop_codon:yes gene_type:complete